MTGAVVVYVTASDSAQALEIGRTLVSEQIAACANVIDGVNSVYRWQGKVTEDQETVLIIKTRQQLVERAIARVRELHSYDCPCVVSWPITAGDSEYLAWIDRETVDEPDPEV